MKISKRRIAKIIQESMAESVLEDDMRRAIDARAAELLRADEIDKFEGDFNNAAIAAAKELGPEYVALDAADAIKTGKKNKAAYKARQARQPEIDAALRRRLENDPYYQARMAREVFPESRKITMNQLRSIIREAITGNVHGDKNKPSFLSLALAAQSRADFRSAAESIMDSFMIDDVFPEEVEALVSMLTDAGANAAERQLHDIADRWIDLYRSEKLQPKMDRM